MARVDLPATGAALIGNLITTKANECGAKDFVFIEGNPSDYLIVGISDGFVRRSESFLRPVVGGWQAT